MTPLQVVTLFLAFATELLKLINAGVDHATALTRIKRLGADFEAIDHAAEDVANGG